jgi:hypothetical protein
MRCAAYAARSAFCNGGLRVGCGLTRSLGKFSENPKSIDDSLLPSSNAYPYSIPVSFPLLHSSCFSPRPRYYVNTEKYLALELFLLLYIDLQVQISALEWDVDVDMGIEQGPGPDSSAEDSKLACLAAQRSAVQCREYA